jgi:Polyketide cyclase / dehydrase and lipid transport
LTSEIFVTDALKRIVSCPTGLVNAPIEVVWSLLTDPTGWATFFDIRVLRIFPPGLAVVGQRIYGESGPRILRLAVTLEYTEIDTARRQIGLNIQLPLGITVRENLSCSTVGDTQCRVNYHCDFNLPTGWRGAIARVMLGREFEAGPVDSLSRLTRAAELEFSHAKH